MNKLNSMRRSMNEINQIESDLRTQTSSRPGSGSGSMNSETRRKFFSTTSISVTGKRQSRIGSTGNIRISKLPPLREGSPAMSNEVKYNRVPDAPIVDTRSRKGAEKQSKKAEACIQESSESTDIGGQVKEEDDFLFNGEQSSNSNLELDLSTPTRPRYKPSPYQVKLLSKLLPEDGEELADQSEYAVCQGYALIAAKFVDLKEINDCVNLMVATYPILTTTFFRNPAICDADVECRLSYVFAHTIPFGKYIQKKEIEKSQMEEIIKSWKKTICATNPFSLLLLEFDRTKVMEYHRVLVIGASSALLDYLSLGWISSRLFMLLGQSSLEAAESLLETPEFEEEVPFEFVTDKESYEDADYKFWRSQCIVTTQDSIEMGKQFKLEQELLKIEKDTATLRRTVLFAESKQKELTEKLVLVRKRRKDLEIEVDGCNQLQILCDPVTLNPIYMTEASKKAFLYTALGELDIGLLLKKNGIPDSIISQMTIDDFLLITEFHCDQHKLESKDRKQLLAFVDSCKNKVKNALEDNERIKLRLEREISKLTRAIEFNSETIAKAKKKISSNEKRAFEIKSIVNPEVMIKAILPVSTRMLEVVSESNYNLLKEQWGTVRFDLRRDVVEQISKFSSSNSIGVCALAAFAISLKHSTGQNQFLIGLDTSIRPQGAILGPLTDVLPVQIDLTNSATALNHFCSLLDTIFTKIKTHSVCCPRSFFQDLNIPVYFQYISFDEMNHWQDMGSDPVNEKHGKIEVRKIYRQNGFENFDIRMVVIKKTESEIECILRFRDKFQKDRMDKFMDKFETILESFDSNRVKVPISTVLAKIYV